jgi:hypothetical protein
MSKQNSGSEDQTAQTEQQNSERKPYTEPRLVEYGDLATLTQNPDEYPDDGEVTGSGWGA